MHCRLSGMILLIGLFLCQRVDGAGEPPSAQPPDNDYFEKHVRPILADHCYSCHGPDKSKAGLRFDSINAIKSGMESNALYVVGKPDQSKLLNVLSHTGDIKMPPKKKLSQEQIDHVRHWIEIGRAHV